MFEKQTVDLKEYEAEKYEAEEYGADDYDAEAFHLEAENRIRNLMWTVSGDYTLDIKPDLAAFRKSKYIALYDAVKQGAFSKYFDQDALSMYIVKKVYLSASNKQLMTLSQLCVDAAIYRKISRERRGIEEIRRLAFQDIMDHDMNDLTQTFLGQVELRIIADFLRGGYKSVHRIEETAVQIDALENATDTMDIIRTIDQIYNSTIEPDFEKKNGSLEEVLAVTIEELREFNWQDFLEEEMYEDMLDKYVKNVSQSITHITDLEKRQERRRSHTQGQQIVTVDPEALKRLYSFVEINYGRTYLSEQEQERLNYNLCRGIHEGCSLYFTDGILKNAVRINYQYKYAQKQLDKNKHVYYDKHRTVKRNIAVLTDILKKALMLRSQIDYVYADHGQLKPNLLWKVGRTNDNRLFTREIKKNNSDFVVDILMDGSGSQSTRQAQVAIQAYIISEALSNIAIPHRVMSFCTFWDYTIMRRFREYDESRQANQRILEFTATSNNRDGLAIKAVTDSLMKRPEEHKILIILSDGRPNDVVLNRPGSRQPQPYCGDYGVRDTAFEVRKTRSYGISVLGVFAGKEDDLNAEKKIFGKDFAYIRDINNFSNVVGAYLKKQLDEIDL